MFRSVVLSTFLLGFTAMAAGADPSVTVAKWGKLEDGSQAHLYTLTNAKGAICKITDYGTIVTEIHVPDKNGKLGDVVLGFDNLDGYLKGHPYYGANVGRVANRIAKGKFTLDGKEYTLAINNKPNTLHGGNKGFDKQLWTGKIAESKDGPSVQFTRTSKDGEEGYPGNLEVTIVYTWTNKNSLKIDFSATTDKATPVNLAHHSYFNLAGHDSGDILGHLLAIDAARYTPTDDTLIPTGKIEPVLKTPFDFLAPTAIGKRIGELKGEPGGYDLNYVVAPARKGVVRLVASVQDPKTGRTLEVHSNEPGVQFYSGNFLDGTNKGKGGFVYKKHGGFCLEPQHFPDSVNQPTFPSVILKPSEKYAQQSIFAFGSK